jgi:hypothetical protein
MESKYTYRVTWSEEDGEHVGLCSEFPSLSWLDESPDKAFRGIRGLVADILKEMAAAGEAPPVPIAERRYSGKLSLRITPDLHRRIAMVAAEENISVNRVINDRLSSAV